MPIGNLKLAATPWPSAKPTDDSLQMFFRICLLKLPCACTVDEASAEKVCAQLPLIPMPPLDDGGYTTCEIVALAGSGCSYTFSSYAHSQEYNLCLERGSANTSDKGVRYGGKSHRENDLEML